MLRETFNKKCHFSAIFGFKKLLQVFDILRKKKHFFKNKPYDEVLGAAQLIKLEIHLIV